MTAGRGPLRGPVSREPDPGRDRERGTNAPELVRVDQPRAGRTALLVVFAVAAVAVAAVLGGGQPAPVPAPAPVLSTAPVATLAPVAVASPPATLAPLPTGDTQQALTPTANPANAWDIVTALDALDQLRSYRFTYVGFYVGVGGDFGDFSSTGVVVNANPRRILSDTTTASAPAESTITIGAARWTRLAGSAYRLLPSAAAGSGRTDGAGGPASAEASPPFRAALESVLAAALLTASATDLGTEVRDGIPARHIHLVGVPEISGSAPSSAAPSADPGPAAAGNPGGIVDAWIAGDGHLVAVHVSPVGEVQSPVAGTVVVDSVQVTISAVDDPGNAVEQPYTASVADAGGSPGQPPTLQHALNALARLRSYRMAINGGTGGVFKAVRRIVVNTPRPAVDETGQLRFHSGRLAIRFTGGTLWVRNPGASWTRADPAQNAQCPTSTAAQRAGLARCTFASLTDLSAVAERLIDGFAWAGDHEMVNGVKCLHLHSDAGGVLDTFGPVGGSADLWVADDGGFLVRLTIGGSFPARVDVTRVNDPANRVSRP